MEWVVNLACLAAGLVIGWWAYVSELKFSAWVGAAGALVAGLVWNYGSNAWKLGDTAIKVRCAQEPLKPLEECRADLLAQGAGIGAVIAAGFFWLSIGIGLGYLLHWMTSRSEAGQMPAGGAASGADRGARPDPLASSQATSQPRPAPEQPTPTGNRERSDAAALQPPAAVNTKWITCPNCSHHFAAGDVAMVTCPYCSAHIRADGTTTTM